MVIRLHDSQTRQVRDFVPVTPGCLGLYVCGPTPQSGPHIGHVRAQVSFDVLRRWFAASGYRVTYVRNVTDIDDKILIRSAEAGVPWWAHAFRYEREFAAAYEVLNVLPPTIEPRATGHTVEMVELIQRLLDRDHAYVAEDGSGDVYFDVRSWPAYGELTHQRVEDMEPAADADPSARKRDPRDFALWKGHKESEPATASWPAPWGRGRPGWHIECSAMAARYLGATFDLHGGGLDLRFPHHENEQAQSHAAGYGFANFWLHNGWVVTAGEKMSKSLGNTLSLSSLLQRSTPVVLRYLMAAPHYRSSIEVGDDSLTEAATAYERIANFVARAVERVEAVQLLEPTRADVPEAFAAAMDDDIGVPAALAVLHETVREGNRVLAPGGSVGSVAALDGLLRQVLAMTSVLGVNPLDPHWSGDPTGGVQPRLRDTLDHLVRAEIDARAAARKERDFATADAIRDRLSGAGIQVEDTPDGARWSLAAPAAEDERGR